MYPNLTKTEVLEWVNSVYATNNIDKKLINTEELHNLFSYLISFDGLLFWQSKRSDPIFKMNPSITISGTHSFGELVKDKNVWTSVDEEWVRDKVLNNPDPDIRNVVKDLMEG